MTDVFDELKHLIAKSGISVNRLSRESKVCRGTIDRWLDGQTRLPRIDTMLRVARVVGREIELTGRVRKMVGYYPPPKPPQPRFQLWRLRPWTMPQ
jgi:transcriptional regulator with XRE-family HTH domain